MQTQDDLVIASQARLEYTLTCDLAVAWLASQCPHDPRIAVLATAPVFAREIARRSAVPITILTDDVSLDNNLRRIAPAVPGAENRLAGSAGVGGRPGGNVAGYPSAVWASPQPSTWLRHLRTLDTRLAEGGGLVVVTAGYLGWLLPRLRRNATRGEPAWPTPGLQRAIERQGYRIESALSIGGPAAVGWATLRYFATFSGMHQLADRYEAGYRLSLAPSPHQHLAILAVFLAHKQRRVS
jgi:hypothetical protein